VKAPGRPAPLLGAAARGAAWATRASVGLAAALMLLAIAYQVLMRYVFGATPSWSEELAVLLFCWTVLGGLALGVHEGYHVRLTVLVDALPRTARIWGERATDLVTAALGAFLAWSGWRFLDITSGSVSAAIGYPTEILNVLAPLSGALIALFGLERALRPGGALPEERRAA
jgi:TRAP-type C4-dicarboxylate transport system permease small subunit